MPIYEYRCERCDNVFEVIQKFVDLPVAVHPNCGGSVVRLISTSALQFKGSGFYITDYKKTKSGSSAKPANGAGGDSSPASESAKSDPPTSSTPAATPATTTAAPAAESSSKPSNSTK